MPDCVFGEHRLDAHLTVARVEGLVAGSLGGTFRDFFLFDLRRTKLPDRNDLTEAT